jgi:hypothetical protein
MGMFAVSLLAVTPWSHHSTIAFIFKCRQALWKTFNKVPFPTMDLIFCALAGDWFLEWINPVSPICSFGFVMSGRKELYKTSQHPITHQFQFDVS